VRNEVSDAVLVVRFPNGDVRFGIFFGSTHWCYPNLFDDPEQAWEMRRTHRLEDRRPGDDVPDEPVQIYSDYGYGRWWEGRANRLCLTDGQDPDGQYPDNDPIETSKASCLHSDREWDAPDWVKEALAWDRATGRFLIYE